FSASRVDVLTATNPSQTSAASIGLITADSDNSLHGSRFSSSGGSFTNSGVRRGRGDCESRSLTWDRKLRSTESVNSGVCNRLRSPGVLGELKLTTKKSQCA